MPATVTPLTSEGKLIRGARKAAGLTIPEAARKAGISTKHWGNIERGHTAGTPDMLALIARSLGIKPARLEAVARTDAADALREMAGAQAASDPVPSGEEEEEEDRAAIIAAVQQLYGGDTAVLNAAMLIMTNWSKPLALRRAELRGMDRGIRGDAAEARS